MSEKFPQGIAVIRSSRRKTAAIQVTERGVSVRVPAWVSQHWIDQFIHKKRDWIALHVEKIQATLQDSCLKIERGSSFPFMGQKYHLEWQQGARWQVALEKQQLLVRIGKRVQPDDQLPQKIRTHLQKWLREQAEKEISQRVNFWAEKMGLSYKALKFKSYRRRWGSCSASGELSFNWRLILADIDAIDYVVIHELAHLVHFNHSQKFWLLVTKYCPNWKAQRAVLQNKQGWLLW